MLPSEDAVLHVADFCLWDGLLALTATSRAMRLLVRGRSNGYKLLRLVQPGDSEKDRRTGRFPSDYPDERLIGRPSSDGNCESVWLAVMVDALVRRNRTYRPLNVPQGGYARVASVKELTRFLWHRRWPSIDHVLDDALHTREEDRHRVEAMLLALMEDHRIAWCVTSAYSLDHLPRVKARAVTVARMCALLHRQTLSSGFDRASPDIDGFDDESRRKRVVNLLLLWPKWPIGQPTIPHHMVASYELVSTPKLGGRGCAQFAQLCALSAYRHDGCVPLWRYLHIAVQQCIDIRLSGPMTAERMRSSSSSNSHHAIQQPIASHGPPLEMTDAGDNEVGGTSFSQQMARAARDIVVLNPEAAPFVAYVEPGIRDDVDLFMKASRGSASFLRPYYMCMSEPARSSIRAREFVYHVEPSALWSVATRAMWNDDRFVERLIAATDEPPWLLGVPASVSGRTRFVRRFVEKYGAPSASNLPRHVFACFEHVVERQLAYTKTAALWRNESVRKMVASDAFWTEFDATLPVFRRDFFGEAEDGRDDDDRTRVAILPTLPPF